MAEEKRLLDVEKKVDNLENNAGVLEEDVQGNKEKIDGVYDVMQERKQEFQALQQNLQEGVIPVLEQNVQALQQNLEGVQEGVIPVLEQNFQTLQLNLEGVQEGVIPVIEQNVQALQQDLQKLQAEIPPSLHPFMVRLFRKVTDIEIWISCILQALPDDLRDHAERAFREYHNQDNIQEENAYDET